MFEALGGRTLDSKSSDISSKRVSAYDNALIFVISLLHLLTVFPNKVYLIFSGFVSWKYLAQRKVLHSRHSLHNTLFHLYNSHINALLSHLIFCFVYRVSFEYIPYSLRSLHSTPSSSYLHPWQKYFSGSYHSPSCLSTFFFQPRTGRRYHCCYNLIFYDMLHSFISHRTMLCHIM